MLHRLRLVVALVVVALTPLAGLRAEEPAESAHLAPPAEADEDNGPPSKLPLATFKAAVAKVQVAGLRRMPELSAEGDHGLILVGPDDTGLTIMAQRAGVGARLEKGAAGTLSRFVHKGHEAFFAQITDDDGEEMAFILVKYPEHNMALFITAKPIATRAELMKVLAMVEL